jgi:hypothetical protein
VTSLVSGNGSIDLELNTTNSTALSLASRQSGANSPQLVVSYTQQFGMNLLGKVLAALIPVDLQLDDPTTEPTPTASDTPEPATATPPAASDTPVPSPSATPTSTPTPTLVPTATLTPTNTATPTETYTLTITFTPSQTLAATATATPTVTNALTITRTPTATNTATTTWTPTVADTATVTNRRALSSSLFTYPTEPPPAQLTSAQYIYDGDGNLVKSVVNDTTTYYPSRQYVDIFSPDDVETVQKYYSTGSQTIAEVTVTNNQATLNWILSDQVPLRGCCARLDLRHRQCGRDV